MYALPRRGSNGAPPGAESVPESRPMTGITRAHRVDRYGWEVGMHVVPVGGGRSLVYSPTWTGEGTFERVLEVGEPAVLLAPNHFHHLSLKRFRERFPEARAVTSAAAMPRLLRQGHAGVAPASESRSLLPNHARFLETPFTKSGETFFSFEGEDGRTWLVCDAFFNVERPVTGVLGVLLRSLNTTPGLRVGRTFRWLAVSDRRRYLDWLEGVLREESPRAIHFAHGEPMRAADLPERLLDAARRGLS